MSSDTAPETPVDPLARSWELVNADDTPGAMRHLRSCAGVLPLVELGRLTERIATSAGFEDLAGAAAALASDPGGARVLYDFGYACVERGASFLAVPALEAALRTVPGTLGIVTELVSALEDMGRHSDAVSVLLAHDGLLRPWPDRYLLAYNALMDGQLTLARQHFALLPAPEDEHWAPARQRVGQMLDRAAAIGPATPLDRRDLRDWHYVLTGGLLTTLSPFGFDEPMAGRYAYLQDTFGRCHHGLLRLRLALDAAGASPATVSLLPDRSSRVLGLAAAELFGLPALPYAPGREDTLVVAYDLHGTAGELLATLRQRAPGQTLFEHATCWTDSPSVSADVSTLLSQLTVAPWNGGQLRMGPDGRVERLPADDRPEPELAAELLRSTPTPDTDGDAAQAGSPDERAPFDPDSALRAFTVAAAAEWASASRDRVRSSGPAPSSRFR